MLTVNVFFLGKISYLFLIYFKNKKKSISFLRNRTTDAPAEPKPIEQDVIEHSVDGHHNPHRHHHGDETVRTHGLM